jgi:predicted nucleic acid-binding protein
MSSARRIYWDSSCFICFLNKEEKDRRLICEDILQHAEAGKIEIWISTWVIVEVIRPKKPGNVPLPEWAVAAIAAVPKSQVPLEELWARYQRSSPTQKLTALEIAQIQGMFDWPFLKKMHVDERVAKKAVEIARDYGLKPGDAVHAASALFVPNCSTIQRWDKDFDKVKGLIPVEDPQMISAQQKFDIVTGIGPRPEEFEPQAADEKAGEKESGKE